MHEYTNKKYNKNGFNIKGIHKDTNDIYDSKGFNINKLHKNTNRIYDLNGFDINKIHRDTNKKYDKDGFDINGINKDTGTFFNKKGYVREYISKNIDWLEDKYESFKLYNEIIKNGEFTITANKKVISSKILKKIVEDILNRKIDNCNKKEEYKKRF